MRIIRLPYSMCLHSLPGSLLLGLSLLGGNGTALLTGQTVAWRFEQPIRAARTGWIANQRALETSGIAASRAQPGVLWTHGDSDDDPLLFAIDTLGHDLGSFRVVGASNVDWEAVRLAPCATGSCLFIGDIGDNTERRSSVTIYRVPEPRVTNDSSSQRASARATALRVRYPDGSHDAEAMLVTPVGDIFLITKGRGGGVRVYRVPASAWDSSRITVATLAGTLPIRPDSTGARLVTDAALAPDGVRVVVRTYRDLYFFRLRPDRLITEQPPRACNILGLEIQGEGVDWLDGRTLVLTSEKAFIGAAAVSIVQCPSMRVGGGAAP